MNFTALQLKSIIDTVIPEGPNGEPPASLSRAAGYIINYLESGREASEDIVLLLERLSKLLNIDEKGLKEAETAFPLPFRRMTELIYTAYYGDPEIVKKLGLPGPPQPHGHSMLPFDENLLENVKKSS